MQKKVNILFSVFFVGIMAFLGIITVVFPDRDESLIENRRLTTFSELKETKYLDGSFQKTLEKALTDQFLGRYALVKIKKQMEYGFLNLAYFDSSADTVLRKMSGSGVSQIGNTRYMMDDLLIYSTESDQRVVLKAEQINELQKRNPEVQISVYLPVNQNETAIFDETNGLVSAGPQYRETLKNSIQVPFKEFEVRGIEDIYSYYQSSDHHMNYLGLQKMYEEIMSLNGHKDWIKKPEYVDDHIGKKFYGTFSSRTGYILEPDEFKKNIYDIKPYQIHYNNEVIKISEDSFLTLDPASLKEAYPYYYNYAYPSYEPLSMLDFDQPDKPNILVVGDSLSRGFIEVLASSYNHTYRLVPYDYTAEAGHYFDYDRFIAENNIDEVVFCYGLVNYYYKDQWGDRWELTTIPEPEQGVERK